MRPWNKDFAQCTPYNSNSFDTDSHLFQSLQDSQHGRNNKNDTLIIQIVDFIVGFPTSTV